MPHRGLVLTQAAVPWFMVEPGVIGISDKRMFNVEHLHSVDMVTAGSKRAKHFFASIHCVQSAKGMAS